LNAEIIGLQEVHSVSGGGERESHQVDYLARATGLRAVAGPTIQRANSHYGNLLLTSRPIRDIRYLDLSVPGREPRGAIDADLDIDGETIRVIVTHLGLRASERKYQVKRLLTALSTNEARLTVLLADLNEWFLLSRPLRWLKARLGRFPVQRTFPSFFPMLALDRILVSPIEAVTDVHVHKAPPARIASDHLPLKATLAIE